MNINHLTKNVAVSPQITIADIATLKAIGFKSIICNRPDGEDSNQQSHQEIEIEADKNGLSFSYLPVINTAVSNGAIRQFKNDLKTLPPPILAYCRTGTRSATLWSFSQALERDIPEIIKRTKSAGYDMSSVIRHIINNDKQKNK